MGKREPIHLRVNEDTKEEWTSHVENSAEYNSMADLIRIAVQREISDEYGPLIGSGGGVDADTGELTTAVERLQTKIEDLESTVSHAADSMYTVSGGDDFTTAVFSELLTGEESAQEPQQIAHALGVESAEVHGALEQLRSETNLVRRLDEQVSGRQEPAYYRVK